MGDRVSNLTSPSTTRATKNSAENELVLSMVLYIMAFQLSPAITVNTFARVYRWCGNGKSKNHNQQLVCGYLFKLRNILPRRRRIASYVSKVEGPIDMLFCQR